MKTTVQCVLFMVVVLIIVLQPNYFVNLSNTNLGNILFVILLVSFSLYDKLCGLIMLLLVVSLKQTITEEFTLTKKDKKAIAKFKSKNCKGKKLLNKGKKVSLEDIGSVFPKLNFDADKCNPCDEKCKFKVSTNAEQLNVMESLRSESSNSWPVKNIDSNEKQVENFSNIFSVFSSNEPEPQPVLLKMYK